MHPDHSILDRVVAEIVLSHYDAVGGALDVRPEALRRLPLTEDYALAEARLGTLDDASRGLLADEVRKAVRWLEYALNPTGTGIGAGLDPPRRRALAEVARDTLRAFATDGDAAVAS